MKHWLTIFLLGFALNSQAQKPEYQDFTAYYLFNLGYTYQNIHYFEGGLNTYLVQPNNNIIDLGATANLGYSNNKFIVIPEAQVGYLWNIKNADIDPYSKNFNSAFWTLRASASPWHITPELGITVLSLLDVTAGYGFEFKKHPNVDLQGLKLGISVRLPFLLFWHD